MHHVKALTGWITSSLELIYPFNNRDKWNHDEHSRRPLLERPTSSTCVRCKLDFSTDGFLFLVFIFLILNISHMSISDLPDNYTTK